MSMRWPYLWPYLSRRYFWASARESALWTAHRFGYAATNVYTYTLHPVMLTTGSHWTYKAFVEVLYGKLVGDKGYIGKELFQRLFVDGIQLITKLKNNMKGALMSISDKLLLRKRAIIETVNDELKNIAQMEHSRHRSVENFVVNTLAALAAYCFFPKKPSIAVERSIDRQLTLF